MPEDEHDKFIAEAIEKPGYLHRALGVPEGERIPRSRIEEATHSENKHTARAARLALTLEKLRKRRGHNSPGDQEAYKGYLITETFHGFTISKGGHHISSPRSKEEAKSQIDLLV